MLLGGCNSQDNNAVIDINNTLLLNNQEQDEIKLEERMPTFSFIKNKANRTIISEYRWHKNEEAIKQTIALRLKIAPHDSDYTFILTSQENLFSESDLDEKLIIAISEENGKKIKM
jgi:hypothetical protein